MIQHPLVKHPLIQHPLKHPIVCLSVNFSDCLSMNQGYGFNNCVWYFLTSFSAIELKNLLKWLEITLSSVTVSFSIFKFDLF